MLVVAKPLTRTGARVEAEHAMNLAISARCPICWDSPPSAPTITTCGHTFCRTCIMRALTQKKECPTCRALIVTHRSLRPVADMEIAIGATETFVSIAAERVDGDQSSAASANTALVQCKHGCGYLGKARQLCGHYRYCRSSNKNAASLSCESESSRGLMSAAISAAARSKPKAAGAKRKASDGSTTGLVASRRRQRARQTPSRRASPRNHTQPDWYDATTSSAELSRLLRMAARGPMTGNGEEAPPVMENGPRVKDPGAHARAPVERAAAKASMKRGKLLLARRQRRISKLERGASKTRGTVISAPAAAAAAAAAFATHSSLSAAAATISPAPSTYAMSASGWPLIKSVRRIQYPDGAIARYAHVTYVQHSNRRKPAKNPYQAKDAAGLSLGLYSSAEAAAEAYSRHLGFEEACLQAQAAELLNSGSEVTKSAMSEVEADAIAAKEGLTLRRSSSCASGYTGVTMPGNLLRPYCAYPSIAGQKRRSFGVYSSAAEAALVCARVLAQERA